LLTSFFFFWFSRIGPADGEGLIDLQIALARDTSSWAESLLRRSTPGLPTFGQKPLSRAAVAAMARPSDECVDRVRTWIQPVSASASSVRLSGHGDWLDVRAARVSEVAALLHAEFFSWAHPLSSNSLTRCASYSIPESLRSCVDLVGGVKHLPSIRKRQVAPSSSKPRSTDTGPTTTADVGKREGICPGYSWEDIGVCPQLLRKIWNVGNVTGSKGNGNVQSVAEFNAGDNYAPADLEMFQKGWGLPRQTVSKTIGPNDPSKASIEADMDVQFIIGVNQGTPTWVMNNQQDTFLQWLISIGELEHPPYVHSVSYGEDADTIDLAHMKRCNDEFIKMGHQGVSFLFATGDFGVNCHPAGTRQVPTFPAGSPWYERHTPLCKGLSFLTCVLTPFVVDIAASPFRI
jgi:tripeptidyl-peptidase I